MYIFDTNIFLRLAIRNDAQRPAVLNAVRLLRARNEIICFTPQILGEFWNVCTRPLTARGGLGLSIEQTEKKVRVIESHFRLLPDTLQTFQAWRRLVFTHSVSGVQVHDAKIAASMLTYGVTHLLTFNVGDFRRFGKMTVIAPPDIT
jgi:predicted nucleic acid-binding protein